MNKFALYSTDDDQLLPDTRVVASAMTRRAAASDSRNNGKTWEVDFGWPAKLDVMTDFNHVDEGSCDLLTGLVRAVQPDVCLETGTHKGRSTAAIVQALEANCRGHLWTLDMEDFKVKESEALTEHQKKFVTFCIGKSPEVLSDMMEQLPGPIEFAYLDGGHEYEVLRAELDFVKAYAAETCVVAVDNSLDDMWPGVRKALDEEDGTLSLPTMCGMDILIYKGEKV